MFHETVRAGLAEDLPGEPYVREPAYDPATQVVRYDECPMNWNVYHETRLPEGVRGIRRYIGEMGGEREGEGPPPSLPEGEVCLVINENRVGSGAPLHDHLDLEEMFIPVEGRWGMYWLDERGDRRQDRPGALGRLLGSPRGAAGLLERGPGLGQAACGPWAGRSGSAGLRRGLLGPQGIIGTAWGGQHGIP